MGREIQYVNILVGGWLVASAFLWPHSQSQFTGAFATGVACALVAAISGTAPRLRFINTGLAVWLFISTFALFRLSMLTALNNVVVAVAMFAVSLATPSQQDNDRRPMSPARG